MNTLSTEGSALTMIMCSVSGNVRFHAQMHQKAFGSRSPGCQMLFGAFEREIEQFTTLQRHYEVWPGGVMVKVLACDSRSLKFNSRPFCCQVTTLGKLFTHVPLSPSSIIWHQSHGSDVL